MLYTKRDIKKLEQQADDKNLGPTVRQYYKRCIAEIKKSGRVDTERVKNDADE